MAERPPSLAENGSPEMTSSEEANRLREENDQLRTICSDLHWMARRYADGRMTGAPAVVNACTRQLLELGLFTLRGPLYARDGMGRNFDRLTDAQAAEAEADAPRGLQAEISARERMAKDNEILRAALSAREAWIAAALEEAAKRYPAEEAQKAVVFLRGALGPGLLEPTAEDIAWATVQVAARELAR
jgi:hypothetical protein